MLKNVGPAESKPQYIQTHNNKRIIRSYAWSAVTAHTRRLLSGTGRSSGTGHPAGAGYELDAIRHRQVFVTDFTFCIIFHYLTVYLIGYSVYNTSTHWSCTLSVPYAAVLCSFSLYAGKGKCCMWLVNEVKIHFAKRGFMDCK